MLQRSAPNNVKELERQKAQFKARIATDLYDEEDPLAVYEEFVQWTLKTYGEGNPNSGLLELLKQATEAFKEDPLYKNDLRFLKLWSLYARHVERSGAIAIYVYLLAHGIGTSYSVLYEEYADLLEADGRHQEAEAIYSEGLRHRARPIERLKKRYQEFQGRFPSTSPTAPTLYSTTASTSTSPHVRPNPFTQHVGHGGDLPASGSSASAISVLSFSSTPESRYAHMLAPPAPEKRPERQRFDFSLLFTDGVEYSIQEARARSMGLLGKKWGPPSSEFAGGHRFLGRTAFGGGRKSVLGGPEPTVTINTKEALADVFGMYNSPEKTSKSTLPGSKHAPVRKIDPLTPQVIASQKAIIRQGDENAMQNPRTPTPSFRPYVDEIPKSTGLAPGPTKFTPFVDPDQAKSAFTPRAVLGLKDPACNPQLKDHSSSEAGDVLKPKPIPEETSADRNVPFKVFTPAQTRSPPLAPLRDVFTEDHGKPHPKPKFFHERAKSHHGVLTPAPQDAPRSAPFAPSVDENSRIPFRVFSRPPEQQPQSISDASNRKTPTFTPYTDPKPAFAPFRTPLREVSVAAEEVLRPKPAPRGPSWSHAVVEVEDSVEEEAYDEDGDNDGDPNTQDQYEGIFSGDNIEGDYEGDSYQEAPLGGRFGRFNVMTPITERTFEFTSSTRQASTPSERFRRAEEGGDPIYDHPITPHHRDEHSAFVAAEQLAAELRDNSSTPEDEADDESLERLQLAAEIVPGNDELVGEVIEKAGQLSLSDTLTLNSKFRPSNPCNPLDPPLMSMLLSRIPTDSHYYDHWEKDSNRLDSLQKFSRKARKASGNTSNTGVLDLSLSFSLKLNDRQFSVMEKLGEGGFGAVFKARDLGTCRGQDDEDEDLDENDEDGSSLVAIKVVRPRNLWEYHVLRRLNSALPMSLRRSVISPHALYAFRDESFLVLDFCSQGTLLSIVNNAVPAGVSQQGACLDELLVMFFTIELLRLLEAIHVAGFIHGDLKIDNCLLRLEDVPGGGSAWTALYQPSGEGGWRYKGLKLIDFGRTIDTKLFPPGQQYIADWATDDRDCFEVREKRPWTYQTDYFGLAGIVYCMLFGKYIQASSVVSVVGKSGSDGQQQRYKISTPLKRYWQTDLWNRLFDVLLNPCLVRPDGQLPVSSELKVLKGDMEAWLQVNCNRSSNTLKGLLKKVEVSCLIR